MSDQLEPKPKGWGMKILVVSALAAVVLLGAGYWYWLTDLQPRMQERQYRDLFAKVAADYPTKESPYGALFRSIWEDHPETLKKVVEEHPQLVEARHWNYTKATPLQFAASLGRTQIMETLLSHGARLESRDAHYRETPLGWAIIGGQVQAARILLDRGAPVDTATIELAETGVKQGFRNFEGIPPSSYKEILTLVTERSTTRPTTVPVQANAAPSAG